MTVIQSTRASRAGRCAIGPPADDPHVIDGPDLHLCVFHKQEHHRWERARDRYVERAAEKAAKENRPFDAVQARDQREAKKPYKPQGRPDRKRPAVTLGRADATNLRSSTDALLRAKVALDEEHQGARPLSEQDRTRLLKAIQAHARLVDDLLAPRPRR